MTLQHFDWAAARLTRSEVEVVWYITRSYDLLHSADHFWLDSLLSSSRAKGVRARTLSYSRSVMIIGVRNLSFDRGLHWRRLPPSIKSGVVWKWSHNVNVNRYLVWSSSSVSSSPKTADVQTVGDRWLRDIWLISLWLELFYFIIFLESVPPYQTTGDYLIMCISY